MFYILSGIHSARRFIRTRGRLCWRSNYALYFLCAYDCIILLITKLLLYLYNTVLHPVPGMMQYYNYNIIIAPLGQWRCFKFQVSGLDWVWPPQAMAMAMGIEISVALIQVRPPGYFINISVTTPVVSALKNYYR